MHKNPYSLSDFDGDTMEDIKNKIVRDLGLPVCAQGNKWLSSPLPPPLSLPPSPPITTYYHPPYRIFT
jgi:hypothetical protein